MIFGKRGSNSNASANPYSDADFMKGFMEGLAGGQGQAQAQPQQTVNTQKANQQGGMASETSGQATSSGYGGAATGGQTPVYPAFHISWDKVADVGGALLGGIPGAILGMFGSGGDNAPAGQSISPELIASLQQQREAFEAYQQQALTGQAGLPQEYMTDVMSRGSGDLAAQSAQQQESLMRALSGRGMLRSGAEERGLRDISSARMGGIADLSSQLMQQDVAARMQNQRGAAASYVDQLRAALGAGVQERAVGVQENLFGWQQEQSMLSDISSIMAGLYPKPDAPGVPESEWMTTTPQGGGNDQASLLGQYSSAAPWDFRDMWRRY